MMIIDKKRIKIILGCILMGIFAFSFQITNQSLERKCNANNINSCIRQNSST